MSSSACSCPTHRAGADTQQDPIRFRNLPREAQDGLKALGLRTPHVREFLAPAESRLTDFAFWRHQSHGLAYYLAADLSRSYRLPLRLAEQVVVADRFHVKPLPPLFTGDGHFFILAVSQNQAGCPHPRLLEASRHSVHACTHARDRAGHTRHGGSRVLTRVVRSDVERQIQFHTGTPAGTGDRAAVFYGHDESDLSKERILQYFREVDARLSEALSEERAPLVLASALSRRVKFLFAIYRDANTYSRLLEGGVAGNPEALSPAYLHASDVLIRQAWALVEPHFLEERQEAESLYQRLSATDRTSADLREVLIAAHGGRVDVLFVASDVLIRLDPHEWGRFDLESGTVQFDPTAAPGNEDLLNLAVFQTVMSRDTVYAVKAGSVPGGASLAAVMRY